MTGTEAKKVLSNHLMECMALMPIDWLNTHGPESSFVEAFEMSQTALDNLYPNSGWISIDKQLPEPFVSVLGYDPGEAPLPTVHECYIDQDGKWCSAMFYGMENVLFWKPMPKFL